MNTVLAVSLVLVQNSRLSTSFEDLKRSVYEISITGRERTRGKKAVYLSHVVQIYSNLL